MTEPSPARCNLVLAGTMASAGLLALIGAPLLARAGVPAALWLAGLLVVVTVPHWALIHEAVHGHMHSRPALNDGMGRVLAILFAAPFDTLRFGHLSHHALNARAAERPEFFDSRTRSWSRAALVFYFRLLLGVYLLELAASVLSLLPRAVLRPLVRRVFYDGDPDARGMADRAERVLLADPTLRRIRFDATIILTLFALSAWAYGPSWPVLVLALCGRGVVVSLLDNAPHYGGPLAEPDQGFDLRLPGRLGVLVLHSNLHGTHHRHPNLPWTALPAMFRAEGARFAGSYLVQPWRQLRGPLPLPPASSP